MYDDLIERLGMAILKCSKAYTMWSTTHGLSDYYCKMLYELYRHPGQSQRQLVLVTGSPKQSINKGIKKLQKANYLTLTADSHDGRIKLCYLNRAGQQYAKQKLTPLFELERMTAAHFGREKLVQLANLNEEWTQTFCQLLRKEGQE